MILIFFVVPRKKDEFLEIDKEEKEPSARNFIEFIKVGIREVKIMSILIFVINISI